MKTITYAEMLGRAAVALTLVTTALVVTTGEASATSATRVARTSDSNSVNKSVVAECPRNLKLIGTGGEITGGNGEVVITDIIPTAKATAVLVAGGENGGYGQPWTVTAIAICSSVASQVVRESASADENGTSQSPRDALVSCNEGSVLLGMGYSLSGAAGNVFPASLTPLGSPPHTVVVNAYEDLDYAPNWNLKVFGICGIVSVDVEVAMATSDHDSDSPKSATADCPDGMVASSAGGNNGGQVSGNADDLILERMTPDEFLEHGTTRVAENLGIGADWTMTAYVICVD